MTSEPMVEACFDGNFGGGLEKWENWRSFSSFDRREGSKNLKRLGDLFYVTQFVPVPEIGLWCFVYVETCEVFILWFLIW